MKRVIAILLILTLISLAGCAQKQTSSQTTTDESAEVSEGISEADTLEQDLDTSEVDTIADELEEIDW